MPDMGSFDSSLLRILLIEKLKLVDRFWEDENWGSSRSIAEIRTEGFQNSEGRSLGNPSDQ